MDQHILQLEVSSPAELQEALANYAQNNGTQFAAVRVFGPNVLTRQFNFPSSSIKDMIAGLKQEASETLSVAAADVEVSCQITGTDEQGAHGVISAMPRGLLMDYLQCFKDHSLIPVSLTASAVGAVDDFLKDVPLAGDNFCLVNFLKPNAVNIIIFANTRPTFFRELYDLSEGDLKDKITDTIRYSCSHSASKSIGQIYFIGDIKGKDDLIKSLKELENHASGSPVSPESVGHLDLTGLNLLKKQVLGLAEREKLVSVFSIVSGISLLLTLILAWQLVNGNAKYQAAKSKVNMGDYNRALDLQAKVRRLSHV